MYSAIAANKRNTVIIIGLFVALLGGLAYAWGVASGNGSSVIPILIFVGLYTVFQYYAASSIAIAMSGAIQISKADNPRLWNTVENLAIREGMPMPKVYIIPDEAPNAFATGRDPDHALIAFTTRILEIMDRDELQGVIAHELSHVANRDTLVSAVAATTAGAIAILSDFLMRMMWFGGGRRDRDSNANPIMLVVSLLVLILAPIAATLLKSAISRRRESLADATAVSFTRNPAGLRKALEVLAADSTVVHQKSNAVAHIWIESPLDGKAVSKMFSTHPPIQERIATLRAMESLGQGS